MYKGSCLVSPMFINVSALIMRSSFVPLLILFVLGRIDAESDKKIIWKGLSVNCINDESDQVVNNSSVSCHVIRFVRKIAQKLLEDARKNQNIKFINDISLVDREYEEKSTWDGKFFKNYGFLRSIVDWLQGRELRFKLRTLLPVNLENAIEQSLPSSDEEKGRKKDDGLGAGYGGGSQAMLIGLMLCKMMAAMGIGALGLVAMKALVISAAALTLSLLAALKKMSNDKNEEKHVVYAQEIKHGHYRQRKSLGDDTNYPYRAYVYFANAAQ